MSEQERRGDRLKQAVAVAHELRRAIIVALLHRPASAAELAAELGLPADRVRYQLRQLADAGVVEVAEEKARRGVVERFYLADDKTTLFEDEELEELPPAVLDRMHGQILKASLSDALDSLKAGMISRREGSVVAQMPLRIDAQGWSELVDIYREALDRAIEVRAESAARLREGDEEPLLTSSSVLLFELPTDDES
jgi:DNA-binding transcriptional ArsR family regulator